MNIKHNANKNAHSKKQTTRFLIISFSVLLLISIGTFITLGHHMNKVTEESINTLGNIYMSGINDHITAHFRTLIDLKLEQAEAVVEVVPSDANNTEKLYEELIYRVKVRNFNYLALCSKDGDIE
ncbi:MAG: response regulator, partial [Eubacterium sp.]|nr:response regulator [Eubacterium sp.]